MGVIEIFLIGIGLSMDAVAVSMTDGMCYRLRIRHILEIALAFGIFQGLMPLIGYFLGSMFTTYIAAFDHWIALVLLCFIGGKMIWDGIHHESSCPVRAFSFGILMMQAVATSIDALAVGISFAAVQTNIWVAISIISITTFLLSSLSVKLGTKIGDKLNSKAEIFGGTILILIGLKIFLEHTLSA